MSEQLNRTNDGKTESAAAGAETPEAAAVKKKKLPVAAVVVALLLLLAIGGGITYYVTVTEAEARVREMLELAEEYLRESDYKQAVEAFEDVVDADPKNGNAYLGIAEAYIGMEDYEEAMEILGDGIEALKEDKTEDGKEMLGALADYLDEIEDEYEAIEEARIEAEREAAEEALRIEEENERYERFSAVLSEAYEAMASKDYERILEIDGTDEADALAEELEIGECYLYFPEGREVRSGVAAGIYSVGDNGYYFFYGEVEDGVREGEGVICYSFNSGEAYSYFLGDFHNDAPNGEGVLTNCQWDDNHWLHNCACAEEDQVEMTVLSGNFTDGLCDGDMTFHWSVRDCNDAEHELTAYFHAEDGIPEEYPMEDAIDDNPDAPPEEIEMDYFDETYYYNSYYYIYQYLTGYNWYNDFEDVELYFRYSIDEGEKLGIFGFSNSQIDNP